MIDKGDIPCIQYTMNFRGPKSMRKVNGLSLVFIDFYVLALTPRLNSTENQLQLSENIIFFEVCRIYEHTGVISKETERHRCLGHIIYIYILYKVGDRTEPCGTPAYISLGVGISPMNETLNFLWERKEPISLIRVIENFNLDNLYSKPMCHVVSKAFSISKNTGAVACYC
jgi:hypothetical protein